MSENQDQSVEQNYEQLRKIGAQRIHEETHIPKVQCEDLVNGYFESMTKIQFVGFISILEREYSIDLTSMKKEALEYFSDRKDKPTLEESKVFIPKKATNFTMIYVFAAIIILGLFFLSSDSNDKKVQPTIDSSNIEQVSSEIATKKELEAKEEALRLKEQEIAQAKFAKEIKIIPNVQLWVGYIDLDTGIKKQTILEGLEVLELDSKTHWLLTLGHGDVTFDINGELDRYKEPKNIRFTYKDGELKKISYREFLNLNKGKEW